MINEKNLLSQLTESVGGSGDEGEPRKILIDSVRHLVDEVSVDYLGNVVMRKNGEGMGRHPRIMLAAHLDEITLIVKKIDDGGFLRLAQVGVFDPRTLLGQEVTVFGREPLYGIIGSKPPHLSTPEERKKSVPLDELFVDLGMNESNVKEKVRVGDRLTIRRKTIALAGDRMSGKAMDNRASVTALAICLMQLDKLRFKPDVYAVATTQEEIGAFGAETAAFRLQPDLAIAVDVCHGEMPGVEADLAKKLGEGPVITFGPRIHPKIYRRLLDTVKEHRLPFQIEVSQGPTWTDADNLQVVQMGIPSALISIPLRYMHTSVETLEFSDVQNVGLLLAYFIAGLNSDFVEELTWYLKD